MYCCLLQLIRLFCAYFNVYLCCTAAAGITEMNLTCFCIMFYLWTALYTMLLIKTQELSTSFHPDSNQVRALHLAHRLNTSLSFGIINKSVLLIPKALVFLPCPKECISFTGLLTQHSSHCSHFDFLNFLSCDQI